VADITAIRTALAARITTKTGLRTLPQARDQVSPPVGVILPREPLVTYGDTMDGTLTINLQVVLIISDAAPVEKTQRALDAYLGLGAGEAQSIAAAVASDPTLAGTAQWCVPVSVSSYGRVIYADITYFGARVGVQIGAI